jgi:hypothetical protein
MKRKLLAALILAVVLVAGASAQLIVGVSGALPLDSNKTSYQQIADQFKSGQGVFYGAFIEVVMHKVGIGFSANTMQMYDYYFDALMDIIDADLYASLHLFGGRALLDPFAELGVGVIGSQWDTGNDWVDASYYWYAALGLGVNLGVVGVSAKFAYNYQMNKVVELADGSPAPAFGTYLFGSKYLPPYRVTIAAKLIL